MLRPLFLLFAACLLGASAPPVLRSTGAPDRDTPPPTATIEQMEWLLGQWVGQGINEAPASENWMRGSDSTLVGTFVQQTTGGDILFTEHMYIVEQDGTLVLKLKHFNADLTGWEEKNEMLSFPLEMIEPCAAKFGGITFACMALDNPSRGLSITVKMKEGGELGFRFHRTDVAAVQQCMNAYEIPKQETCLADLFKRIDELRAQYLTAAIENQTSIAERIAEGRYLEEPDPIDKPDLSTVEGVRASEAAFVAYRDAECGTVEDGVKGAASPDSHRLTCLIRLTEGRTLIIWQNWLAGSQVIPSILPEPELTH